MSVHTLERIPPQNLEAEQGVLGSMLLDRDAIARVVEGLRPEDFYRDSHRVIYSAMLDLFERGEPVDLITVTNRLSDMGKLEDVGGATYLASLPNAVPTAANVDFYAGIVLEKSMLRALISAGTQIASLGYEGMDDVAALIDQAEKLVFGIAARRNVQDFQAIKEILKASFEKIDKRYQEKGTVTGVATGFTDLDMLTSGLQPSDMVVVAARPSVGKCLSYDSEILLEDGSIATIEEVFWRRRARLLTLGGDWRLRVTEPAAFVDNGAKPVFRVTTQLGRMVVCTAIHPFLTIHGWLPLASLRVGERIAVPRKVEVFGDKPLRESEVKLLAYLIGDGSLASGKDVLTNTDPRIIEDFEEAVRAFGAVRGLMRHGLWGKPAARKEIPAAVFTLPRAQLALFLNRLFATGGWASAAGDSGIPHIGYATVRERLARQLQHLLLRFGVIARVQKRRVAAQGSRRGAWRLEVTEPASVKTFAEEIGIFGKEPHLERVLTTVRAGQRKADVESDPLLLWRALATAKEEGSSPSLVGHAEFAGTPPRIPPGRGQPRGTLHAFVQGLRDQKLQHFSEKSDIYWDEIVSIVPAGLKQVYDLTIPQTHNFIANDICVHNTTFATNIAQHAALTEKIPVAIFSLETSKEQLVQRILCSEAQVDNTKLRTGFLADEDWRRIARAMGKLSEAPIFIDDSATLSVIEMRAKARKLRAEHGLGLIVVDYIQMIQSYKRAENRTQELSEIARSLKSLAKELEIPIIAVSQLSRAVEALGQKRPMLSHLRECVTGDTLVLLSDGRRVPIRSLVGTRPSVLSMSPEGRIISATADAVWSVGPREVLEVRLASGRSIRATLAHRLYGAKGWVRVKDLRVGDRLAIARQLPEPAAPEPWPEERIVLLAHLIGDGSYLKGPGIRYTTSSEENSSIVSLASSLEFGICVHRTAGRRTWHQLRLCDSSGRWRCRKLQRWLKELGIFNQRSPEKRMPEAVFQLPNAQIALFLCHLWATDGAIWTPPDIRRTENRAGLRVYYATNSKELAFDVAALLLRLEIVACVYRIRQGRYKPNYHVVVSGVPNQQRFLDRVGTFGPRAIQGERLQTALTTRKTNTNVDTLPRETFERVCALMRKRGISTLRGVGQNGTAHFRFAPSRSSMMEYARKLEDDNLLLQCTNDLFWDRVIAIESIGLQEVFDLTVPGPASWLADAVVNHNSGEIEQVSDLVVFLYREDYYDVEKAQKDNKENVCEIIIAKHRNGPIGTVELYFHKEYSRFANLEKRRQ